MGRSKQERIRRAFWIMWNLMYRTEKYYRNFGPGRADKVLLGGWGTYSPRYCEVRLLSVVGVWFTDVCIPRAC